jgi:ankyrin repeat protein
MDELPFCQEETPEQLEEKQRWDELVQACKRGDEAAVRVLLDEKKTDPDCRSSDWLLPLHVAILHKHPGVVALLVRGGANPNARTDSGMLPTALAISVDDESGNIIGALVDESKRRGVELKYPADLIQVLHEAIDRNDLALIARLINKYNVSVNDRSYKGISPFIAAVGSASLEVVRFLLEHTDVQMAATTTTVANQTVLELAMTKNRRDVAELIAPRDPRFVMARLDDRRNNCSHLAALMAEPDALWWTELILRCTPEPAMILNLRGSNGMTALHYALSVRKRALFERLLHVPKIDLNVTRPSDGQALMHTAFSVGPEWVALLLGDPRIILTARATDASTPLLQACASGDMKVVERLLQLCPEAVTFARSDGITPLHYAVVKDERALVQMMLNAGADVNARLQNRPSSHQFHETLLHLCLMPQSERNYALPFKRKPEYTLMFLNKTQGPPVNINAARNDGTTPLMQAVINKDFPIIKRLFELGVDASVAKSDGTTALHIAYAANNIDMLHMFARAGANLFIPLPARAGETLLHTAIQRAEDKDML